MNARAVACLAGAFCASAIAATVHAAQLGGGSAPSVPIIRILAALVLCALVALAIVIAIRLRTGGGQGDLSFRHWRRLGAFAPAQIIVVESRRLSVHADVCLVRCNGQDYLIACGASGIVVVDQSDSPAGSIGEIDGPEP